MQQNVIALVAVGGYVLYGVTLHAVGLSLGLSVCLESVLYNARGGLA